MKCIRLTFVAFPDVIALHKHEFFAISLISQPVNSDGSRRLRYTRFMAFPILLNLWHALRNPSHELVRNQFENAKENNGGIIFNGISIKQKKINISWVRVIYPMSEFQIISLSIEFLKHFFTDIFSLILMRIEMYTRLPPIVGFLAFGLGCYFSLRDVLL